MDMVNVVFCENSIVREISSYEMNAVEKAEDKFLETCAKMLGRELSVAEQVASIEDGHLEHDSLTQGVSICWSDN